MMIVKLRIKVVFMMQHKLAVFIFILVYSMTSMSCSGLQRKFTRKKKVEEKPAPVITMYDYSKDLRVDELYKKRFLYWKTWHIELIERLDENYKKRIECYEHTVMNLYEMKKYLNDAKFDELSPFIEQIESVEQDIGEKNFSKGQKNKIARLLEYTRRKIEKGFSYSKVKNFLELRDK